MNIGTPFSSVLRVEGVGRAVADGVEQKSVIARKVAGKIRSQGALSTSSTLGDQDPAGRRLPQHRSRLYAD
jgi:hypothetical protein